MKNFVRGILNYMARRSIAKRCQMTIAKDAIVLYREFKHSPPTKLYIGEGSIFRAQISSDKVGSFVSVGCNTFVGGSKLVCAERIEIGNDVMISWGCTIVDHSSHSIYWNLRENDVKDVRHGSKNWTNVSIKPVKIGDRAWIGFNVSILPGINIGEGSVVGASSVVTKDVEPYTIVAGNPAKFIRKIS